MPRRRSEAAGSRPGGPSPPPGTRTRPSGARAVDTDRGSGDGRPRAWPFTARLVCSETRIWPPCPAEQIRATVCTEMPTYPVSVRVGRPPWITGADADLEPVRPRVLAEHPLDRERRVERLGRSLEAGEVLVGVRIDLVTTGRSDGTAQDLSRLAQHRRVATSEPAEEFGRALDVGHEERDGARRKRLAVGRPRRALRSDLSCDEPHGDDAVALGRLQEAGASAFPRFVAFERDTFEPREGVAHVRLVVDRKPSSPLRVDVGEGAVRQFLPLRGLEPSHRPTIPPSHDTMRDRSRERQRQDSR